MLILAVIVVFLALGNCKVTVRSESTDTDNFRVEVIRRNEHKMNDNRQAEQTFYDGKAESCYDIGDEIELTCIQNMKDKQTFILKWFENSNHEFGPKKMRHYENATLRLTIKPDIDDDGLILTCGSFGPQIKNDRGAYIPCKSYREKKISVQLSCPNKSALKSDIQHQYIEKSGSLRNNATCNSAVRFGNKTLASFLGNHKNIIDTFEEKDNGTIVSCVSYVNITESIFERRKSSTKIFYLEPDPEMITAGIEKTENGPSAGIVGGVLGSIIFIIITTVIVMWIRKKHRSSPGDRAADRVIYAELEERLPQRPPPQREETPYAQIIGSLVPKQQPPRVVEPLYCEIAA